MSVAAPEYTWRVRVPGRLSEYDHVLTTASQTSYMTHNMAHPMISPISLTVLTNRRNLGSRIQVRRLSSDSGRQEIHSHLWISDWGNSSYKGWSNSSPILKPSLTIFQRSEVAAFFEPSIAVMRTAIQEQKAAALVPVTVWDLRVHPIYSELNLS